MQCQLRDHRAAGEALDVIIRARAELDLTDQAAVRFFMQAESPIS